MEPEMIRPLNMEMNLELRFVYAVQCLIAVAAALIAGAVLFATDGSAASMRVKAACASDYFAHCSKYSPNSQETRDCMHDVGEGLSKRCVNALVADGEVSDDEVAAHTPKRRDDDE
jgi:hypothetical protein